MVILHPEIFETMRALREEAGMSQEKVARAIDISLRQYQRIEAGNQYPSLETFFRLAELYQVSLDYLAGRSAKWEVAEPLPSPVGDGQETKK